MAMCCSASVRPASRMTATGNSRAGKWSAARPSSMRSSASLSRSWAWRFIRRRNGAASSMCIRTRMCGCISSSAATGAASRKAWKGRRSRGRARSASSRCCRPRYRCWNGWSRSATIRWRWPAERCQRWKKPGRLASRLAFLFLVQRIDRRCGWDGVLLFGPRAQIDLLAAVRAERAVFVFLFPLHFFGAGRAGHYGHDFTISLKVTERELKRYFVFQRLRFQVAALGGEAHPQHVFVGRDFGDRALRLVERQAQHLVDLALQHLLVAAGDGDHLDRAAGIAQQPQYQGQRVEQGRQRREPVGDVVEAGLGAALLPRVIRW